jgi:hypothetical protein
MVTASDVVTRTVEIVRRGQALASSGRYAHALDAIAAAVMDVSALHTVLVGPAGSTIDLRDAQETLDAGTAMLDAIERGR